MRLRLQNLNVQFKRAPVDIDLDHQICFFHGPISTGKSSIARIIDYCLGGDLVTTPALKSEFVSARLSGRIGQYDFVFDREGQGSSSIGVTWRNSQGESAVVLAPLAAGLNPIWGKTIFNFSDLICHLAGIEPMRVRKSRSDPESQLVRLSIRDLLWYCYLQQEDLDSSFFHLLDEPSRMYKSRDVMRFIAGYYTQELNRLEQQLDRTLDLRKIKQEAAGQIEAFLTEFGFGSELEVQAELERAKAELQAARDRILEIRKSHDGRTHFSDELRSRLRQLGEVLAAETTTLKDLEQRSADQQKLRDELLSIKFKLSRTESAVTLLTGAQFEVCPNCGNDLEQLRRSVDVCIVCGFPPGAFQKEENISQRAEAARTDIDSRITDLEVSTKQYVEKLKRQRLVVEDVQKQKQQSDEALTRELIQYDSAFLSNAREAERNVARLEEKIRGLENTSRMPRALTELHREVNQLFVTEKELRDQIKRERSKLTNAVDIVHQLQDEYLGILVDVGVPGITSNDKVVINLDTWLPRICPNGDISLAYDFYEAGSGGKKTLLKVCYALALHKVVSSNDLPLPRLLIIDSPMKNIDKEVNIEIFLSFYRDLYGIAANQLADTQFVIVDNEFASTDSGIDLLERHMTAADPLIPYYQGP